MRKLIGSCIAYTTTLVGVVMLLLVCGLGNNAAIIEIPQAVAWMSPVVAGGGTVSDVNTNCSDASPTGCLFYENIDGSTACVSGGTENCNNTWTSAVGSPDYSDTTLGTYTFAFHGSAYEGLKKEYTQINDIYIATKFRIDTIPGGDEPIIRFLRADDGAIAHIICTSSGEFGMEAEGGDTITTTGTVLTIDTNYYLKLRVQRSGNSITGSAWWATSDGSWNSFGVNSNGTNTQAWTKFVINTVASSVRTAFFKDIRLDDADITSFGQ